MAEYKEQLVHEEEVFAPDDLIAGEDHIAQEITLATAGDYQRGCLLMAGENGFVNATAEGVASAEVCILCDDASVPSGSYVVGAGYFRGTFNANAVILPYETAESDHAELIEAIRVPLRKQGIFLV